MAFGWPILNLESYTHYPPSVSSKTVKSLTTVLLWASKKLYKAPPQGSVFYEACKVFAHCFKNGGWKNLFKRGDAFWDAAKPSNIEARQGSIDRSKIFWDDLFVEEIKQSVRACGVFFLIPIFLLADGGIGAMENTQSAAMTLNGVPNDVINNFNSIVIIVATPIMVGVALPLNELTDFQDMGSVPIL